MISASVGYLFTAVQLIWSDLSRQHREGEGGGVNVSQAIANDVNEWVSDIGQFIIKPMQ